MTEYEDGSIWSDSIKSQLIDDLLYWSDGHDQL
jgi:hypothetical protein